MNYLFTSESVSEGHPDKVADQISDALLDEFLAYDPNSKVACETLVTTGQVVLAGEVKSNAYVDLMEVARRVIHRIGYNKSSYKFDADSCGIFSAIHEQSADINRGVERAEAMSQGAGDQGMMFGYACNETDNYMPLSLDLSHLLLTELAVIRREASAMTYLRKGKVTSYLRPDSKSQVTIEYNERNEPVRVHTIVLSTQHDEFVTPADDSKEAQEAADREMLQTIYNDVKQVLLPRVARTGTNLVRRPVDFISESYRQIRYRRASRGYGIDGSQDYRRHVWRQRWSRRWRIFGKRSLEGRPFGRIRRSSYCQEFGSGRGVGRDSGAGVVRHRSRRTGECLCEYLR